MKRLPVFLVFWTLSVSFSTAQNAQIDSLKRLLAHTRQDTSRVLLLAELANNYRVYSADSNLKFARESLQLALKSHFVKGEGRALTATAYALNELGDIPQALEAYQKALEIARAFHDSANEALTLNGIGILYNGTGTPKQAIPYYKQAKSIYESLSDEGSIVRTLSNLAIPYIRLNFIDSARMVLGQGYTLGKQYPGVSYALCVRSLGDLEGLANHHQKALGYYREALRLTTGKEIFVIARIQYSMALLFKKTLQLDSSLYYAKSAYTISINKSGKRTSADLLARLYKEKNMLDSAFKYLDITHSITESVFGPAKLQQLQQLALAEQERKQILITAQKDYQSQVRFYAVLVGLGVLLLIAFILYRTNRQKHKANTLLSQQKQQIEQTLSDLRTTQTQLIQREKMASLGELTAGIAHEIQNPLNFVNNFSEVSVELIDELKEEAQAGRTNDVLTIADDLSQNLQRITLNGQRASNIVKGMLEHSRSNTGEREPTDLNVLCEEYLRLAYQGVRAKQSEFTCQLNTHLTPGLPLVEVITQDMSRVLLNLFNNAFYAVGQKQKTAFTDYQPTVWVETTQTNGSVEIRVRDNGVGIPDAIKEKIFQPFFTTKPTGEGTGLGLSLSYDIVTKGHGGTLRVESEEGQGTQFFISLPFDSLAEL